MATSSKLGICAEEIVLNFPDKMRLLNLGRLNFYRKKRFLLLFCNTYTFPKSTEIECQMCFHYHLIYFYERRVYFLFAH